ncbi:hypothetical protein MAR_013972 [Mya arenaria]|uniref:Caspase family p10 domain-containing protein n=1 Tax=Mya arenaria TaxID=6604 RepID=A0ABY7G528_MYAAR|nr:hypothetical protein MAR_013972 [Mya arenaria]
MVILGSYGKDEGVSVKQTMNPTDTNSGEQTKRNGSLDTVQEYNPKDPIPRMMKCNRDTLMMFAVPTGRPAYRNIKTGSWLFACIKEALEKQKQNDEPVNLLSVLTDAAGLMAEMESKDTFNTYKAVPVIDHQLLRNLTVKVNIL